MSGPNTPPPSPDPNTDARVALRDNSARGDSSDRGGTFVEGGQTPANALPDNKSPSSGAGAEPTSNGHSIETHGTANEGDGNADHGEGRAAGPQEPSVEASTPGAKGEEAAHAGAPEQDRKRRRRRRRKKAEGQAIEEVSTRESGEAPEGAREGQPDAAAAGGGDRVAPKGKKREKRSGPPRERPPVNAGDIVFGKIVEIGQDAIFIDIPGKARAIFDRNEMLLPDDDEAPRSSRSYPRAEAPAAPALQQEAPQPNVGEEAGRAAATDDSSTEAAAPGAGGTSDEAVPRQAAAHEKASSVTQGAAHDEPVMPADAQVASTEHAPQGTDDATPAASNDAASEPAPPDRAPEPNETRKEPKVPRVILEVGADFIGVVHNDGARGGLVVLTHHPNRGDRAKAGVEAAFNDKAPIFGLVTGVIKGGIEVDVDGLRAFAPGSHVDLRLGADLSHLVGRRLSFAVTQYAKRGRDVVLSRKSMLEEEARKARAEALAKLKVGEDLDGIVRSVVPFGAFVDVGGVEGLVPLQEMSHNRADGPSDVFKAGEPTRVRVIKIDDKGKVWLSRKATVPDPWQQVAQKYAMGTRHTGKVARLQPFGAFLELEPGVDGLIHTQDLSIKRIDTPADVVKVGDTLEVVVSHIDASQHKIALHPAPQGDAAAEAPQRVAPHKPVKAKVVNIESGGLVVRIMGVTGRNARGYVTAAGTGTPRGTELRKAFNVGQEIEAKVIEMDPRRGEVKLSIKALGEDQERNAYQQYRQQLKAEARFTFGDLLAKKGK